MDFAEQIEVLARWSCKPRLIDPLRGGAVNEHWRVEAVGGEAVVLRRYHPGHDPAGTQFEHDVLWHLWQMGWPVATPIPTPHGDDVVTTPSGRWSLFPFLPGDPAPRGELIFLQRKGAVLALIQRDLAKWEPPGQRAGFGRVTDLDTPLRRHGFEDFEDLVGWLAASDATRAEALTALRARNLRSLDERGYPGLPDWTIHGECLGNNVLFKGKDVTGLVDFDFVHRDARVADAARALVVDCGLDSERIARWLGGYATFCEPGLSPDEAAVLPELMLANALWNVAIPLSIAARGGPRWMRESAEKGIDTFLPRLEASIERLRQVTHAAAGFADDAT